MSDERHNIVVAYLLIFLGGIFSLSGAKINQQSESIDRITSRSTVSGNDSIESTDDHPPLDVFRCMRLTVLPVAPFTAYDDQNGQNLFACDCNCYSFRDLLLLVTLSG
jgi:hypothetical protein